MNEKIFHLYNSDVSKICIFGVGKCGISLFKKLRDKLIYTDFFCDNDINKYGYVIDNKYCISFEKLKKCKDDTLVIVSPIEAKKDIIKQLKDNGFKFIISMDEFETIIQDIPSVNWFKGLESIDYSSKEMEFIISTFKSTIFDVCRYYEDKLKQNLSK